MTTPDKNFRSYADCMNCLIENETLCPPDESYADTLKFSNAHGVTVRECSIFGGTEDCIDLNRGCTYITIKDCDLMPAGKYAVTIKGGTSAIQLKNVFIHDHGDETDIDIGNWSDQSKEPTGSVILQNVCMTDGSPVRCRVLWGERPIVIGGNVKVTVVPRVLVWAWRMLRKLGVVK